MGVDRQVEHRARLVQDRWALLSPGLALLDRLGQQAGVQIEPDGRHVPGLLATQDVPGAADLQVGQRDLEAGAKLGRVEDRLEALAGLVRETLPTAIQQVGVGPPGGPPHPAAELVELGQPERICPIDDDRVGVRDVQAGLDDGGAHEDVRGTTGKGEHDLLQGALRHLTVPDHDPDAGQHRAQLLRLGLDRLDPVVHVEDLAAAVELAQDRVLDQAGRGFRHPRLDRQPVLRRRLDDAHVANAGERQVERARDGRGRQGEHVNLGPEPLETLLGRDPEALLLVDDDQTQVSEADVLREQPVGPDDEVHRASRQPGEGGRLLAGRDEPGE